jgi:small subunit ribosomal protein S20
MANTKSAEKRMKQALVRRDRNRAYRSKMRTAIKKLRAAVVGGDPAQARELLTGTLAIIDATAQKQVIHRNTAARYKARLTTAVQKMEAAAS